MIKLLWKEKQAIWAEEKKKIFNSTGFCQYTIEPVSEKQEALVAGWESAKGDSGRNWVLTEPSTSLSKLEAANEPSAAQRDGSYSKPLWSMSQRQANDGLETLQLIFHFGSLCFIKLFYPACLCK